MAAISRQKNEKNTLKSNKVKAVHTTENSSQQDPSEHFLTLRPDTLPAERSHDTKAVVCVASSPHHASAKTRVIVKYDVGFPNHLTIRGKGANLSWDRGQPLKNLLKDEWVWETDQSFQQCEFKVLINDTSYEVGGNHSLHAGGSFTYTPHF